jgi:hypothetical protein
VEITQHRPASFADGCQPVRQPGIEAKYASNQIPHSVACQQIVKLEVSRCTIGGFAMSVITLRAAAVLACSAVQQTCRGQRCPAASPWSYQDYTCTHMQTSVHHSLLMTRSSQEHKCGHKHSQAITAVLGPPATRAAAPPCAACTHVRLGGQAAAAHCSNRLQLLAIPTGMLQKAGCLSLPWLASLVHVREILWQHSEGAHPLHVAYTIVKDDGPLICRKVVCYGYISARHHS